MTQYSGTIWMEVLGKDSTIWWTDHPIVGCAVNATFTSILRASEMKMKRISSTSMPEG